MAYALRTDSAMRGLDPAVPRSRCVPIPAKAGSHALSTTSVSRWKSRLSQRFLAVDLPAASKRHGHRMRAGFFCGNVAPIDYAAEGVRLLTPFGQLTAIQDVPQRVEREATCAPTRMDGGQPLVGMAGFGMCASALQWMGANHAPMVSGEGSAGRCSDGTVPARGVQGKSGSLGSGWLSRDRFSRDASRGGVME
jgi:hypothetical protein